MAITSSEAETRRTASLVRDARARLIWGDSAADVRQSLIEFGVDPGFADHVVSGALSERAAEVRAEGAKDVALGAAIILISPVPIVLLALAGVFSLVILGACFTGVVYGLFRFGRGLYRLFAGARVRGSVTDL